MEFLRLNNSRVLKYTKKFQFDNCARGSRRTPDWATVPPVECYVPMMYSTYLRHLFTNPLLLAQSPQRGSLEGNEVLHPDSCILKLTYSYTDALPSYKVAPDVDSRLVSNLKCCHHRTSYRPRHLNRYDQNQCPIDDEYLGTAS